ncbi:MAG: aconitase family protein, partial [Myxococcota bacterium]
HYGVNTDLMISGAACTLGYTPEILGPHFLASYEDTPVDGVRRGGFQVLVGGPAYGSGSSREVAVTAHQGAGIQLVIAESLQRIFQENLVFAGMPFTTDLRVLDRLRAGEGISIRSLSRDLPPFFRAVADHGGLLPYATALLENRTPLPYRTDRPSGPMTVAEKLLAQNAVRGAGEGVGVSRVTPGEQVFVQAGFLGLHEYTAGMVMSLYREAFGAAPLAETTHVACFEDHFTLLDRPSVPEALKARRLEPARRLTEEMHEVAERYALPLHGPGRTHDAGVCHRIVVERYAEPGMIVALTDSHTPTAGVLNAFAYGVGSTAMAFALRTGWLPATVPLTVRVNVRGRAHSVLSPKDLILHVIGDPYFREEQWRRTPSDTCVLEWAGEGLEGWTVDELSVLTNMTVEGGLMTG